MPIDLGLGSPGMRVRSLACKPVCPDGKIDPSAGGYSKCILTIIYREYEYGNAGDYMGWYLVPPD